MSNVDLSALRIDQSQVAVPRKPLGPRLLVLAVVLLALAVAATFLGPLLLPPRAVRMADVHAVRDGLPRSTATATTEAVGWVEADPFPHIVRPLVSGHIETLEVLEGARVVAGETVVARLVSADLQAALDRAQAAVGQQQAMVERAQADERLARERLAQNADNLLRVREAETRLAAIATRRAAASEDLRRAEAMVRSAAANVTAQERLAEAGNSYPVALERARADADAARADVGAKQQLLSGLEREHDAQRMTLELCRELADDPVDLRGAVHVATAKVAEATAALEQARTDVMIAERELGWAVVHSPVDGVVMRLEAQPGDMVGHGASGVVALYDPKQLRARIDVPLDSLAGIHEGQRVELTSEATGDTVVRGVVQRLQHETDLLKNTLQVKVGLDDPPELLRPETLCRARFLAPARDDAGAGTTEIDAFRVPKAAVRGGQVFVYEPASRSARAVTVEVVGERDGAAIVRGPLSPTQKVVLDPVEHGESVVEENR